jgi:hypothetical protein
MTSIARRGCFALGGFSVVWMPLPELGIGCVTTVTSFAVGVAGYAGMFRACGHRRRPAADDPENGEQRDDSDSDRQKIKVFPVHKRADIARREGESP